MAQFSVGANISGLEAKGNKWGGDFRGRPELMRDIYPYLQARYGSSPIRTILGLKTHLRCWWRLLDKFDAEIPIARAWDFNELHGAIAVREGFGSDKGNALLTLVNTAREDRGMPRLFWSFPGREEVAVDLPPEDDVRAIYHHLKRQVQAMFDRFDVADGLAELGKDWTGCYSDRIARAPWSDEEIHATFRGVIREFKHPLPDVGTCNGAIGTKCSTAFHPYGFPAFGLYPSVLDVTYCLLLFVARSGWNLRTALDIDAEGECVVDHPTSPLHHVVLAPKIRGTNEQQVAIDVKRAQLGLGCWRRPKTEPLLGLVPTQN